MIENPSFEQSTEGWGPAAEVAERIDLDSIETLDTENVCHVLSICPKHGSMMAICGAVLGPDDCYFGCRLCVQVGEGCPSCGRAVCETCIGGCR